MTNSKTVKAVAYDEIVDEKVQTPSKIVGMLSVRLITTREQPIFEGEKSIGQMIDDYLLDCKTDNETVQFITFDLRV